MTIASLCDTDDAMTSSSPHVTAFTILSATDDGFIPDAVVLSKAET